MEAEGLPGELGVRFLSRLKTGTPEELAVKCGSPVRRRWGVPAQQWDIKAGHSSPSSTFGFIQALREICFTESWNSLTDTPRNNVYAMCVPCGQCSWHTTLTVPGSLPTPVPIFLLLFSSYDLHYPNESCFYVYCLPPHQLHKDRSLRELCSTIPQVPGGAHKNSLHDD